MPETVCAAAARSHPRSFKPALLAVALAGAFAGAAPTASAQTLPSAGVAVHGQAAISSPASNQLRVVTQNGAGTQHSAINWQSFSLSAGSTANFIQPSATSTVINRVVSNTPSAIFGTLASNGRLVLVNQSGIAVGAGAVIDTAGFTASALRMSDADALAGRLRFGDANASMGGAAGITVGGRITARDGDVVLVAPNIDIGGSALLQAPNGSTILAAGQQVEITGRGLEGITLLVQAPSDQVRNLGRLEGDAVGIFAGTLRHSGEIQATTATLDGGRVVLKAAGDAYVDGAGTIVATGGKGGQVDVLGNRVAVMDQAVVDVSGTNGGGAIRVGGDYQGRNPELPNAMMTHVGVDTVLKADATQDGDGGRVIVWADDVTRAQGRISANAAGGGGGGFVETSGHRYLDVAGIRVTASGSAERPGTWLLDPSDITITRGLATGPYPSNNKDVFTQTVGLGSQTFFFPVPSASVSTLTDGDLNSFLNAGSNLAVILQTSNTPEGTGFGDITFDGLSGGAIVIGRTNNTNTNANSLVFNANRNIVFSAGSTTFQRSGASTGLPLSVQFNPGTTNAAGKVVTNAGASVVLDGVNDVLSVDVKNGKVWENAGTVTLNGLSFIRLPNEAGYATFNNLATGVLNVNASSTWSFLSDSSVQGGNVVNQGVINVNGTAGGFATSWEALFSNAPSGQLNIGAGKLLSVQNGNALEGALNIGAGGELRLSQQFAGPPSISNAAFSGDGKLTVSGTVTADFSNTTGTLGQLEVIGNASTSAGTLTVGDFIQSGGNFSGAAGLTVTKSFSRSGGVFAPTGAVSITQASGNLGMGDALSVSSLALQATAGSITINNAINATNGLTLSAGGSIDQSASGNLVAGGATTVNAPGFNVQLNQASNNFSSIGVIGAAVAISDINAVSLNASSVGSLTLTASGPVTQSGAVQVTGNASINAGTNAVTLTNVGNDFLRIGVTGSAVSLRDANALELGATNAGTSLSVTANGNVTQSAAVLVSGNTAINAGGDVILTTAGNNLNSLSVSGGAINVVEGAGSSLTVTSLTSGFNQPVSIAAGHTLTLPGTPINTGTANLALSSAIGPLTIPAALTGNNISLSAAAGLVVNAPITAGGDFNASVSGGASAMTVNQQVFAGADMALNLAGNLSVLASAGGAAGLTAGGNQNISAGGNILLQGAGSGSNNKAVIATTGPSSTQTIAANGITLLGGADGGGLNAGNYASLRAAGSQSITVGNGGITLTGGGGALTGNYANIEQKGGAGTSQSITINGAGSIVLQGGSSAGTALSGGSEASISSEFGDSQTVTFTGTGLGRAITLTGGTVGSDAYAEIYAGVGTQTITGAGLITLTGGASGGGASFGGGDSTGNLAALVADINHQTIVANGLVLQGGAGGLNNFAVVYGGGNQSITLGAGGLQVRGGGGGALDAKNAAIVYKGSDVPATSQTITVAGGGAIVLQGGSATASNVGTDANLLNLSNGAFAAIRSEGAAQLIEFSAAGGSIQITGGTLGSDNHAMIVAQSGTQTIRGTSAANAPALSLTGGASGGVGGTANEGNRALIFSLSGNQNVTANAISLAGGAAGNENVAQIRQGDASNGLASTQTVTVEGGGGITMQGGNGNTNFARIRAFGTTQTVNFTAGGTLDLTGGLGGVDSFAQVIAHNGDQFVTGSDAIILQGGSGGNKNRAQIAALLGSQTLTIGAGGLTMIGGSGTAGELANFASVFQGGTTGKNQSITLGGGGGITLLGGDSAGTNVGLDNGSLAYITNQGDSQLVEFSGAGSFISITGGTVGSRNEAGILALNGSQTIRGTSAANAPAIFIDAGADGGVVGESNLAQIIANNGAQTITARGIGLAGGASGTENFARIRQGTSTSGLASTQSITITGGGNISVQGGGGVTNLAQINAFGTSQSVDFSAGGTLDITGGTGASLNYARIEAVNGNQSVTGSPAITITGGASGGAATLGNFAQIRARPGTQLVTATSLTIRGGAGGIDNDAGILSDGNQTISLQTAGSNDIVIGDATSAHISYITGPNQVVTAGTGAQSGSITIHGGTAAGKNAGIFANPLTPNTGTQTISTTGTLSITGGSATGTASTCDPAAGAGSCADINNDGTGLQRITANTLVLQGGNAGLGSGAGIFGQGGNMELNVGAGGLTLLGGSGGTSNFASIGGRDASGSTMTINVAGNTVLDGRNGTDGSGAFIGLGGTAAGGTITIDFNGTGNLSLFGSNVSPTQSGAGIGTATNRTGATANITVDAANIVLTSGSQSGTRIGHGAGNGGLGDITVNATGSLALNGGAAGATAIRNAGNIVINANTISLANTVAGATIVVDSNLGVQLGGAATLTASAPTGNTIVVDSGTGAFTNTAGAGVFNVQPGARWLVYSTNPLNDTRGGLAYSFKQYDAVLGDPVLGTGNGFLYSVAPTVTTSLVGPITKTFDGTTSATLAGSNFVATGIDGDVIVLNTPVAGTYDTKLVGTTKTVTAGGLSFVSASDGAATVFGYNPIVSPASAAVGTIDSAGLVLTTSAVTKVYDGNTSALGTAVISSGALVSGDTLGGGSFAFLDANAGSNKTVTVGGVTVNDGNGGGNYTVSYVDNTTSTINPLAVNLTGSRAYDGTSSVNAGVLTLGALVGTQTLNLSGAGTMATKHVGTGKALGLGTLALADGTGLASNYTFTGGTQSVDITAAPLTLGTANVIKTYDGGVSAAGTATVLGGTLFAGDTLGTSGLAFSDKNVGIGTKTVTVSAGAVLDGNSGANYNLTVVGNTTSTINPFVVNLSGSRVYDGSTDVLAGVLSTGALVGAETLTLSGAGFTSTKDVGSAYAVTPGTLALADGSGGGLASNYTLAGGTRIVDITRLASVTWTGSVDNRWSTPGNWQGLAIPDAANVAAVIINSGSGDITHDVTGVNIDSLSSTRRVVQTTGSFGTVATPAQLVVSTTAGIALDNPQNRIGTLNVSNSGSGEVSIQNTGILNVTGLTNSAGGITLVNSGGVTTTGEVRAATGNVSITANSPLTVGSAGVIADVGSVTLNANNSDGMLTLNGPVTAATSVDLFAGNTLTQNASVQGGAGVTANAVLAIAPYGALATAVGSPVLYTVNGVAVAAPPLSLVSEVVPVADTLVTFLELFEAAVQEQQVEEELLETNPDGSKKKRRVEDTIVTEGEICR